MKKHGNTHKAPRSSKRKHDNAQAADDSSGKINIATADDVSLQASGRDAGSSSVSDSRDSRGNGSKQRRNDRAS